MQARHPTTGETIRILRADSQVARDQRTLVWVRPTFKSSGKWLRWSPIISEPSAASCIEDGIPTIVITHSVDSAWVPILKKLFAEKDAELIWVVPRAVHKRFSSEPEFPVWERTMIYEDLYDAYPFLGEPLKAEDSVDKVVVSVAHILRFHRLAWTVEEPTSFHTGVGAQVNAWRKSCDAKLINVPTDADADRVIPQCWLIQQYFRHNLPKRAREIWTCLEKNLASPYIDKILLLNEMEYDDLPQTDKIVSRVIGSRLTYADVLNAIKSDLPAGSIAVFSNSDIWFDETLSALWTLGLKERRMFFALLRWEDENTIFGPRADSQDSWIVAKDCVDFEVTDDDFGFPFGKSGCDNAITVAMLRKKFLVSNPAYTIKTHHVHASNIRNYSPRDILYKPFYMHVDPSAIQPYIVETDLSGHTIAKDKSPSPAMQCFSRGIGFVNEAHAKTVCNMLKNKEHNSGTVFDVVGKNVWTPPPTTQALHHFKGYHFVTPNGLVSNFRSIIVGKYPEWRSGWEDVHISSVTPSIHVPSLAAVTAPASCWKHLSDWVLYYLPTVLRIRKAVADIPGATVPEFLVPSVPEISSFLFDSVWHDKHISAVPYMDDVQYFCNEVFALPPPSDHYRITAEDIRFLRELLPRKISSPLTKPTIVFCVSEDQNAVCTRGWVEETVSCILQNKEKWDVRVISDKDSHSVRREAFQAANWIVGEGVALDWTWMARPGTHVLELMKEMDMSSRLIHLAGAAGLQYVLALVRKEPIEYQREHALLDVGKALQKYGFKESLETSVKKEDLPRITLPAGKALSGIWYHSGDTFREMAEMWAERGYCTVEKSEETPFCWWGAPGEVLLYDRPTPRWWSAEALPAYQMALFGNCPPPGPAEHVLRQSIWSFWPRSPKLLEDHLKDVGVLALNDRSVQSIFLGKVENGVQQKHRCKVDWSKAVTEFSMPVSAAAPYPYTQPEYLARIGKAKFGLCLPGYGFKCNREIEYFAVGTVPIVAPDVDVSNYLVPPIEGVHYFRAATPEQVQTIVENTSDETWERMSAAGHTWWRENASAEGLFRLTWARVEQCRPFFNVGIPTKFRSPF
jgi:hypothetical protein